MLIPNMAKTKRGIERPPLAGCDVWRGGSEEEFNTRPKCLSRKKQIKRRSGKVQKIAGHERRPCRNDSRRLRAFTVATLDGVKLLQSSTGDFNHEITAEARTRTALVEPGKI